MCTSLSTHGCIAVYTNAFMHFTQAVKIVHFNKSSEHITFFTQFQQKNTGLLTV